MKTNVESLKTLYVKLGGALTDTYPNIAGGIPVGEYDLISDCILACSEKSSGGGEGLPAVTSEDNGKVLGVVNGAWDKTKAPSGSMIVTLTPSEMATEEEHIFDADVELSVIAEAIESNTPVFLSVSLGEVSFFLPLPTVVRYNGEVLTALAGMTSYGASGDNKIQCIYASARGGTQWEVNQAEDTMLTNAYSPYYDLFATESTGGSGAQLSVNQSELAEAVLAAGTGKTVRLIVRNNDNERDYYTCQYTSPISTHLIFSRVRVEETAAYVDTVSFTNSEYTNVQVYVYQLTRAT